MVLDPLTSSNVPFWFLTPRTPHSDVPTTTTIYSWPGPSSDRNCPSLRWPGHSTRLWCHHQSPVLLTLSNEWFPPWPVSMPTVCEVQRGTNLLRLHDANMNSQSCLVQSWHLKYLILLNNGQTIVSSRSFYFPQVHIGFLRSIDRAHHSSTLTTHTLSQPMLLEGNVRRERKPVNNSDQSPHLTSEPCFCKSLFLLDYWFEFLYK